VARLSFLRRIVVAGALLSAPAAALAQPAGGDPAGNMLKGRLDAEEAARKAAEERLAAAEKALAEQQAAAKAAADAIAAQKQQLDSLAQQLASDKAAREATAAASDKAKASTKPSIASRFDGVSLQGFAQIDYAIRQSSTDQVNDATGEPLNQDRVNLRRARLKVVPDYGRVLGALELDANTNGGTQVRVVGAEASFSFVDRERGGTSPAIVTAGLFKIPFGQEVVESDADRLFLERSTVVRALFPGEFDLGARFAGTWQGFSYSVAVQNGEPLGEKGFPGRDPNAAKDITGHIGVDAKVGELRVVAGASALSGKGFHKGTPSTKDTLVWRDINEDGVVELNEIQNIPGQPAIASENFDRFAIGGDLRLTAPIADLGLLELRGELIAGANLDRAIVPADPVVATRDLRETGYYVQALQELGKYAVVGVRYDHYNPDADATDRRADNLIPTDSSFSTLALDAALRFQNARLIVEYDVNRNHIGRGANGVTTNLKDNALLVRAEVKF
jgi:hypothetical protein